MRKTLIADDLKLGRIGLGCTSLSPGYTRMERNDDEAVLLIHRAVELGITLFDTADIYGPFSNERLLGRALQGRRDGVVIATKCGLIPDRSGKLRRNGRPDYIRTACENSLRRLRTDVIDLYQLHRIDPEVPFEETWGAMAALVGEGKVRALGISHASVAELDRAHSVFPIAAVQYELAIWAAHAREDILPWAQRHSVAFVAFSPIGRGFLSGTLDGGFGDGDSRRRDPRFSAAALAANKAIVRGVQAVADRLVASPAQVALAWVMAQGDRVVPIPGTRKRHWLEENVAAAGLTLSQEDLRELDALPSPMGRMSWA